MKTKIALFASLLFILVIGSALAFAAPAAGTAPVDPAVVIGAGASLLSIITSGGASTVGIIAAALFFVVNLLKMKTFADGSTLADKIIPKKIRPLVVSILGLVGGGAAAIAGGASIPVAIISAVAAGSAPIAAHEIAQTGKKPAKENLGAATSRALDGIT